MAPGRAGLCVGSAVTGRPNPAPDLVAEGASLVDIAAAADACRSCDLYRNATQTVFGEGPADADLMLVGEQPGNDEDLEGSPFVGSAGGLLDRALSDLEVSRERVYVTNIVKHFNWKSGAEGGKPRIHAKPSRYQIDACKPWLAAEIERVGPTVIVLMGATAAQGILGSKVRVTRDNGSPIPWGGRTVVVTIHPAAVLRSGESRRVLYEQFVADLAVAVGLTDGV